MSDQHGMVAADEGSLGPRECKMPRDQRMQTAGIRSVVRDEGVKQSDRREDVRSALGLPSGDRRLGDDDNVLLGTSTSDAQTCVQDIHLLDSYSFISPH